MSFPAYPDYKDSGVAWLGEVPAHWEPTRLRLLARLNPSKSEASVLGSDTEVSFIPMEAVGEQGELSLDQTRPLNEVLTGYTYFREGDVTIAKITPCFENGKGAIMRRLLAGVGFGSTELIVVRPKPDATTPEFLDWLFRTTAFRSHGEAAMYGAGGQKRVPDDFVRNFVSPGPPLAEQITIAAFLYRETAKIDALVAEQERLIALLREKRQAVISHAVTKGLNPDAPMKDSGIEWLGEIPAHWEVKRLRHVADLNPSKGEIADWDNEAEVSFLPMEAIGEDGTLKLDRTRPITDVMNGHTYFRNGDVTIAKITPCFENGKGAVMRDLVGGIGFGTTELIVLRADQLTIIPAYLDCIFRTRQFRALGEGSMYGAGGQKRVPDGFVRDFAIGLPPADEQDHIVGYLAQMS